MANPNLKICHSSEIRAIMPTEGYQNEESLLGKHTDRMT
jgi:hypothetical protein